MPNGRTDDDQHIDLGTGDNIPMPRDFNAPDNASTISGNWGRTMGDEENLIEQAEGND